MNLVELRFSLIWHGPPIGPGEAIDRGRGFFLLLFLFPIQINESSSEQGDNNA